MKQATGSPGLWVWFNPAFFLARDAVTPYMIGERPSPNLDDETFWYFDMWCDSLPKATSCTLALEVGGSATVFVVFADGRSNKKCLYLLIHWYLYWSCMGFNSIFHYDMKGIAKRLTKRDRSLGSAPVPFLPRGMLGKWNEKKKQEEHTLSFVLCLGAEGSSSGCAVVTFRRPLGGLAGDLLCLGSWLRGRPHNIRPSYATCPWRSWSWPSGPIT